MHSIIFNDNVEIKRRTSGAYKIANCLESLGWRVHVVDWVTSWSREQLAEYLDCVCSEETVLFAFSYTWLKHWEAGPLVSFVRNRYPRAKIIVGGQQFFQHDIGCDFYLFGYSELALPLVLDYLFAGGSVPAGSVELFGGYLLDCNVHYPAKSLGDYSIRYRPNDYVESWETLTVELSRGCRFRCPYCNYAFLGVKEDSSTSADLLRAELMENYSRWGTRNYIIADDTVNDRDSKLEMLGEVVQSLPFEPNFAAFVRIDLTVSKPQQLKLLAKARIWNHFYGVETFNSATAKAINKGMDPVRIKEGLLAMRSAITESVGYYRGTLGMIAGLPYEPIESWHASEQWLRTNWRDNDWEWWPLEISTDINTLSTSLMSKDWARYGYSEITDPQLIERVNQQFIRERGGVQHKFDVRTLLWQADWANLSDAVKFVADWKASDYYRTEKLIANFYLLNYEPFVDKDQLFTLTKSWHDQQIHGKGLQNTKIVQPYIQKKLSEGKTFSQFKHSHFFKNSSLFSSALG